VRKPLQLISKLTLVIAATSLSAALPGVGAASPMEERIGGVERFESSPLRRPGRKGVLELAAKKKKKKKKRSGAAADDTGTAPGESDSSEGADTGASDEAVQKAARVNPTPTSEPSSSDDQPAKTKKSRSGAKADEEAAPPRESGPSAPVGRYLDLSVGGQAFSRSLTYHQQIQPAALREYQPPLLGDLVVALQYYPGAQFSQGFVTNLGLELNVEQGISLTSQTPDKIQYPTTVHDYNGGVRVRIPLESLTPFLTVGYGDHAFKLGGAQRAQLVLPDVEYKYVRAVVGVNVPVASGVSVSASGGYRYVLSPGQIKTVYFPQLNVGGMEAKLYVGYALTSTIEARVGFDYRRYFYTFHSKATDTYIVGGGIDQTYAGSLSIAITLGGSDHPASSAEAAPASDDAPKPKKSKRPKMEDAGE
jgi:hypothetical protein